MKINMKQKQITTSFIFVIILFVTGIYLICSERGFACSKIEDTILLISLIIAIIVGIILYQNNNEDEYL